MESVYQKFSDYDLLEYLCIDANREGLYDMLPQGLFHQSTFKRTYKDTVKDFIIAPQDSAFILSDDSHTTYLGINSFI